MLAGGFLRIKREVLVAYKEFHKELWFEAPSAEQGPEGEAIRMKRYVEYFASQMHNHVFYGEDHMFAKRLREMNVPMYIYPNVNIIHYGYKGYEGNYHEYLKKSVDDREFAPKPVPAPAPEHDFKGLSMVIPADTVQEKAA